MGTDKLYISNLTIWINTFYGKSIRTGGVERDALYIFERFKIKKVQYIKVILHDFFTLFTKIFMIFGNKNALLKLNLFFSDHFLFQTMSFSVLIKWYV